MKNWMKPLRLTAIGLLSLSLTMLLSSCVTVAMPPASLTEKQPVTQPKAGTLTNGDVAKLAVDRGLDTEKANLKLEAIEAWYEGYCAALGWRCRLRKD